MHRVMKADFHTHSADDPRDALLYSTEMLIDEAAARGVEVLALTLHEWMAPSPRVARHAERKGVLLVPAIEQSIEGYHIVILNPDEEQARACTFADLRALGRRNAAIIAPHPYYGLGSCLNGKLDAHADLFDAIEYCTLYARGVNWPNQRAVRAARRHNLPLVGTSDTHTLPYADTTHTLLHGEKSIEGVVDAIRAGRVELVSRPRPWRDIMRLTPPIFASIMRHLVSAYLSPRRRYAHHALRTFRPGDIHWPGVDRESQAVSAP